MKISKSFGRASGSSSKKRQFFLPQGTILPHHVALICDGNRRWARARGLPVMEGHRRGGEAIGEIARACRDFGIHTFTVWVFSTENWSRGEKEAGAILKLISQAIDQHIREAKKNQVRIIHLGRKDRIPRDLANKLTKAEEETRSNKKYVFNIAIDYGGNDEIVRVARQMVGGGVDPDKIDEKLFASYLDTRGQPYPYVDLLIRTSGEQRLSGFLSWQMAYAEVWWEEAPLPDFTREKFVEALLDYSRRKRRFGGSDLQARKFNFQPRLVAKLELDWRRAIELGHQGEFKRAFIDYLREQFGISLSIAKDAANIFLRALIRGETEGDWRGTKKILTQFYGLLKRNIKLAFEPSLIASLEIDFWKGSNGDQQKKAQLQEILEKLYAELFRISLVQARRVAHLRALAHSEEEQAQKTTGAAQKVHLKQAEEYLVRSYEALKERVA